MSRCTNCGFEIPQASQRCTNCTMPVRASGGFGVGPSPKAPGFAKRPPPGYAGAPAAAARDSNEGGSKVLLIVGVIGGFAVLLLGLAAAGAMFFLSRSSSTEPEVVIATAQPVPAPAPVAGGLPVGASAKIPVLRADPVDGSPTAQVTVVEFSDFECPYCKRISATLKQVRESYQPSMVRIVWKNFPLSFHKNARPAHEAGVAVHAVGGSKAFWSFHDQAFLDQKALNSSNFELWAQRAGVSPSALRAELAGPGPFAKVDADMKLAQTLGVKGTPHTFVNGISVKGAQQIGKFKEVIDKEIAATSELLRSGTSPSRIYESRVAQNFVPGEVTTPSKKPPTDSKTVHPMPVNPDDPVLGRIDALVTIVEFSDFQCPFCKRVQPTLEQVRSTYGDKVRLVWKDNPLPFHKRAVPAAMFARTAFQQRQNTGFWAAHDAMFEDIKALEDSDLERIAGRISISWPTAQRNIDSNAFNAKIEESKALASKFGTRGTPSFYINGRKLVGAQPFPKFKEMIDEEVIRAEGELNRGTSRARLYDVLVGISQ